MNDEAENPLITDLQSRLLFQEDAIEHLNRTVAEQDRSIEQLRQQLTYLYGQLQQVLEQQAAAGDGGNDIPPHY